MALQASELADLLSAFDSSTAVAGSSAASSSTAVAGDSQGLHRSDSVATCLTRVSADPDVEDAEALDVDVMPSRVTWELEVAKTGLGDDDDDEPPQRPDHGEIPGNIGFFFGNWGLRQTKDAQSREVQANVDRQLKCGPAHILGLCEVQEETADVLRAPPDTAVARDAADTAVAETAAERFQGRDACQYLVVRGQEESSVAIAARASVAEELSVTYWKLRDEGSYKDKKAPDGKRRALTRVLGAEVVLRQPVAFLGDRVKVLCVHFHRMPAKKEKGFTDAYKKFWPYLKEVLTQEKTQVLFGDFNMSLWRVVPELRLLGVKVTLVAWFPWKSSLQGAGQGKPMCDSCGIFVVGQEVAARLQTAVADLHDDDERGWLWRGVSQSYAAVEAFQDGPGQALECYLHKSDALRERVRPSLAYSEGGAKAAVAGVLRLREKRLDMDVWLGQNKIRMKGALFPLRFHAQRSQEERRGKGDTTVEAWSGK